MAKFKLFGRHKNEININGIDDVLLKALLTGQTIDRDKALTLPAVTKAVSFITDTISTIPIKLYKEVNNKVEEVKDDNRVSLLNDDTKDTLDGVQFKRALVEDYLLGKGGYAYINKNRNIVKSLNYVEEGKITIRKNADPIHKKYDIVVDNKPYKDYEFIKVLRNTKDGASGKGLVEQVSKAIETAYQSLIYECSLVKSGGNKRGFLKAINGLDQASIDALKEGWKKLYANDNESNVIVLNKGVEFQEASNSSVEMQLNERKRTLNDEIDSIFHIKSNYNDTFKEAIMPILSAIECALNRDLLLEREKKEFFFSFDLKEILKGTLKERFEAYKIAKETGWMTLNEIRYLENYDDIEGLDIIAMSLGNVIYDVKEKEYYTPNTDSSKKLGEGGEKNE